MKLESLEELRVFVQIVDSGSLTGAARALKLPANTVSRRLASLEDRLGTRLLDRTTRSLSVSEAGRALLTRARRVLDEAESAELAVKRETEGIAGVVRIGLMSVLTVPQTLRRLGDLMDEHPGLRVQVQVHDVPVSPVARGLDVVVIGGSLEDSSLVARKLTEVQPVLVASDDYLARRGTPETPADLVDHDTVAFLTPAGTLPWTLLAPDGERHVVEPRARFQISDGRGVFDAIVCGRGIGYTTRRMIGNTPGLTEVLTDYGLGTIPVYAVYPAADRRSARLQAVVQALLEAVEER